MKIDDDVVLLTRLKESELELLELLKEDLNNKGNYLKAKIKYIEYIQIYNEISEQKKECDSFDEFLNKLQNQTDENNNENERDWGV